MATLLGVRRRKPTRKHMFLPEAGPKRPMSDEVAKPVQAYECGQCLAVHRYSTDAGACCACEKCGTKFEHKGYSNQCGHCSYGLRLRNAREDERRAARDHTRAKRNLDALLAEKRPAKGSAS